MKEKEIITEKDHLEIEWYKDAWNQTLESLPKFIDHLMNDYVHDYGTMCKAMAACAAATLHACDKTENAGITGFQASLISWEFMKAWGTLRTKTGARLLNFDDMLYPQYEAKFNSIDEDTFKAMQKEAKEILDSGHHLHPKVKEHMESIIEGKVPFGYKIGERR